MTNLNVSRRYVLTKYIANIIMVHSICECGEWADDFEGQAIHIAECIVAGLELDYFDELLQPRRDDIETN